jgi:serine protease AprX
LKHSLTKSPLWFDDIHPNPTTGTINVESKSHIESLEIYNTLGARINTLNIENRNNTFTINLSDMAKGIYFVTIKTTDGFTTRKLIKQ